MLNNRIALWLRKSGIWTLAIIAILITLVPGRAQAAGNDFNIQVSPSPLVVTLAPGKKQSSTLTVRNFSTHPETLYPKLNGFTIDASSKNVRLLDGSPANVKDWVTFSSHSVTIPAGGSKNIDVVFNTPGNVGFSYSVAVTLSRKQGATPLQTDGVHLEGAIAVFCLINIDRPDAKRQFFIDQFASDKSQYQFLPANFSLKIRNTGNIIDAPKGTLFIQRTYDSPQPIAAIQINTTNNYILPDTARTFNASWSSGFPAYTTDGTGNRHLTWDWQHIGDLRFGRYVAKVVIIYNDGKRDIPLISSYTFWVIPWTLIAILLLIAVVLVMGIVGWSKLIFKGTRKVKGYAHRK